MGNIYQAFNTVTPGGTGLTPVTTGTALKTLLQVTTPATLQIRIIEWGISFDGSAAATPIEVELVSTSGAATVTAHVQAGINKLGNPDQLDSRVTLSTSATGYTASAEGTPATTILYDGQLIAPTNQYIKQYPLGREPVMAESLNLRIRVNAGTSVNALCYVTWEEI